MPSVSSVWTGEVARGLRLDILNGGSKFCGDCPLKLPLKKDEPPPQRPLDVGPLPSRLYIECTAACNISCNQACCAPETGITRTRQAGMLDYDLFRRVVDEAGPALGRIDFFNYGEAFLHKRALDMVEYIKSRYPHVYLYTSTNGLALSEDGARRLARSGIDEVTFSIDGARHETYVQYRQRGDFAKAVRNLAALVDEKRTHGLDVPFVNWRYILFSHNDSDEEMELARRMAADIGVDRLSWEITDHPENMFSRRFVPGTPEFERIKFEIWDKTGLGNAIPGATPRARIEVGGTSWRRQCARDRGARSGRRDPHARHQPLDAAVPGPGHLRPASRPPRRATLRCRRHPARPRLRARLAAGAHPARRHDGDPRHGEGAGHARPLQAEVRSRVGGDRLVRAERLGNDDQGLDRAVRFDQLAKRVAARAAFAGSGAAATAASPSTIFHASTCSRIRAANAVCSAWPARCATRWPMTG
jgi:hypothetical protein